MVYLLLNIPNIIYMPPISVPFQALFSFSVFPLTIKNKHLVDFIFIRVKETHKMVSC